MTGKENAPSITALRKLEASLDLHEHARAAKAAMGRRKRRRWLFLLPHLDFRRRWLRRLAYGSGGTFLGLTLACGALWWRLESGPISLDLATPWLTSAIEENFGSRHRVAVGGTQLERDETGRPRLRILDIVVRDSDGGVVASAPKAEVSLSGASLLTGRVRAERLSLVGAEMAVRIETDGKVTVFAGADKQPIATAAVTIGELAAAAVREHEQEQARAAGNGDSKRKATEELASLLTWIDGLGATGLDGHELSELGLKNGNLVVDDQRSGKRWSFENINLSLTRPHRGGVVFKVGSENQIRPWSLSATVGELASRGRAIVIDANRVSVKDILLALRMGQGEIEADAPVSAKVRAEIGPDGMPRSVEGRIVVDAGYVSDPAEPGSRIAIDRAEFSLDWDAGRRTLLSPFQIVSGGNRLTLFAQFEAPREPGGPWMLGVQGGSIVLAAANRPDDDLLVLDRILLRLRIDHAKKRIEVENGDIGNRDVGVGLSGHLDYSGAEPRLSIGLAGTRMPLSAMKRMWPAFAATKVRNWVEDHFQGGVIEHATIATNAPLPTLKSSGPPVPEDGLAVEIIGTGASILPVEGLPAIRDADLNVRISGRTATVHVSRGTAELPSGRRLNLSNGVFEVPDTFPKAPPARVRFRVDGPVPAAAELLALERLRDISGVPFDPATSQGTASAQINLGMPLREDLPRGSTTYTISADVTNFAAERMVMGQKLEAAALKISANTQGYQIKGDVKINGTPATFDYRKQRSENDAEIRLQATLDDTGRNRLGFDLASAIAGPVPVKINGRVGPGERDSRLNVEADLTQAKVDNLLPGWLKPVGKSARANFVAVNKAQTTRFEDIAIDGVGIKVKGIVELDSAGDIQLCHFPIYNLSEVDKTNLKAERSADGTLKVVMRGDVYDGRAFVKSSLANVPERKPKKPLADVDLDIKLGAVAGHHGEALRGLELRLARRAGQIRSFSLQAKLGRDTPLMGDLRGRAGGRDVIYIETNDAGAFFRFTDTYPRMYGGQMWVAFDPPDADQSPQEGILNVRDFVVRGEKALENVVATAPGPAGASRSNVEFNRMRVDFTRMPGKLALRDGLVRGPIIGATIDGQIDYLRDDVRMRGTFVPIYGLNNMFGQLPIVGFFLGGSNEGVFGLTYEVVGSPSQPTLRVNPISAIAPGMLRKVFEFPLNAPPDFNHGETRALADPSR